MHHAGRRAEAGIEPSRRQRRSLVRQPLAESINGLYEPEGIHLHGPGFNLRSVDFAAPAWLDGLNYRRRLEPIGRPAPADCEEAYHGAR
jgi:hypothetical protein